MPAPAISAGPSRKDAAMTRNDTEELPGTSAPVLSAGVLARIHELNLDYLGLLAAEHNDSHPAAGQLQYLPCKLHAIIAGLSPPARSSLAALPCTLYSLGFEDERLWRSFTEPAALSASLSMRERYAQPHGASLQASLCEVALLYAWHVATSNPLAARLIYAMPEPVARRLTAAPPWYVRRLAVHHASLLMPRWPTNPGFWPDLVRFAAEGDQPRLATAKVLGSQLIAAELQGSALQSPRLRARQRG
jgi:hypothetical protein